MAVLTDLRGDLGRFLQDRVVSTTTLRAHDVPGVLRFAAARVALRSDAENDVDVWRLLRGDAENTISDLEALAEEDDGAKMLRALVLSHKQAGDGLDAVLRYMDDEIAEALVDLLSDHDIECLVRLLPPSRWDDLDAVPGRCLPFFLHWLVENLAGRDEEIRDLFGWHEEQGVLSDPACFEPLLAIAFAGGWRTLKSLWNLHPERTLTAMGTLFESSVAADLDRAALLLQYVSDARFPDALDLLATHIDRIDPDLLKTMLPDRLARTYPAASEVAIRRSILALMARLG